MGLPFFMLKMRNFGVMLGLDVASVTPMNDSGEWKMKQSVPFFERRKALKWALGMGSLLTLAPARALAQQCEETPRQTEGPFYPVDEILDTDTDLTSVSGQHGKASGQVVYVQGIVTDRACNPIAGATVEIWQASASGRYNHPSDRNSAPLDPYFQYFGKTKTDAFGHYLFKTIVPGAYATGMGGSVRTPHIHFKVHMPSFVPLTTQMYFEGQALNAQDFVLSRLSEKEQKEVIVSFYDAPDGYETNAKIGTFNITLAETLRL